MASSLWSSRAAMGRRGAAATLALHLMVVATLALAAATFMSTAEAACGWGDGVYTAPVDGQGEEQYRVEFLGAGSTTLDTNNNNNSISQAATGGGLGRKLLQQDSGTHCDGGIVGALDVEDATTTVANYFGADGNTIPGRKVLFGIAGCSVVYVCNYNNGPLRSTSGVIWSDTIALNNACLPFGAGYYGREASNSRNGRTYVAMGHTLCG